MRAFHLIAGTALAVTSVWAVAQDPESLLPPGFNQPTAAPTPSPTSAPAPVRPAAPAAGSEGRSIAVPVIQELPQGYEPPVVQAGAEQSGIGDGSLLKRIPSVDELARMTPEEFQQLLGSEKLFDIPQGARRAVRQLGMIDTHEGGLDGTVLASQNGDLVRLALSANRGALVSRWGHILLRRALASRLNAPRGMTEQDFLALRVGLLLRMGEVDAARAVLQDLDTGDFTPELTALSLNTYVDTADLTGICPTMNTQGFTRDDAQWQAAKSICLAFRGDGSEALRQLDRATSQGKMDRIDLLLAQKYAGAAGRARRAVTIEWDKVETITPWRFALANAVGLEPPAPLMAAAPARYEYLTAQAPMVGISRRLVASDRAGSAGILSSAAMVDLYSQAHGDPDTPQEWSERTQALRDAYLGVDPAARLLAMQSLWSGAGGAEQKYSRQVLTAYAAAKLPVAKAYADSADDIIGSMLAAGLDANAARWLAAVEPGSEAWALIALAQPKSGGVDSGQVDKFLEDDSSVDGRKGHLFVAGLAGLGRIDAEAAGRYSGDLDLELGVNTRWTKAIDSAAQSNDVVTVAFLAGLGMQGSNWSRMTPRYLFHIVAALRRVGLEPEARMIAAEAVARA